MLRRRARALTLAALVPLLLAPVLSAGTGSAAEAGQHKKKAPDLVVNGGLLTTYDGTLTGTVSVSNKGTKTAKLSTTSLQYAGAALGSYPTLGLKPGKTVKLKVDVPAPASGTYEVRACADAARTNKEAKEGNNCATITVSDPS